MANNLTYKDFAMDEVLYLSEAYSKGLRYNAMVAQAQRIVECLLKNIIQKNMFNVGDVMMSHNLRTLYDFISKSGIDISVARADIMMLNNFYTHTRYPGKDAFMATEEDIVAAYNAVKRIVRLFREY